MTFLEFQMMLGMTLVSIPVLVHILNRRKAKPIAWGAMRFLSASLETQRRRLLMEEIILLVLRCLAIAAIVTAMARPFLLSQPAFTWPITIPLLAVAAISAGVAAALWKSRKTRKGLLATAILTTLIAIAAAAAERRFQNSSWLLGGESRDIVIVIDGSDSMRILLDGRSNFDRAREAAAQIVKSCSTSDAVGLILAGPLPYPLVKTPISNHREILDMINHKDFKPSGGSFGVLESLNAAAAMLAEGRNPVKKIVVLTDQQGFGWDIRSQARWNYLSRNLKTSSFHPKVIVRRFPFPHPFRNASVADISFPNSSPGAGQTVRIQARIVNGGDMPIQPVAVSLSVNGEEVAREIFLKEIPPGTSEFVAFKHCFKKPGRALISCSISCNDDLESDNVQSRVLDVFETMPVLVIEGAPSKRAMGGAADFIRLALRPENLKAGENSICTTFAIKPDIVGIEEASAKDMGKYRAVILANPTVLPKSLGDKLLSKVMAGGGLLVVPGSRTDAASVNSYRSPSGEKLLPADMAERKVLSDNPAHFALKTFTGPALRLCADNAHSDASLAMIRSYWKLETDKSDVDVSIGGLLDSGDPFIAERKLGRGLVAITAFAMDRDDSTLPSLKVFVPLMHELVYHLASYGGVEGNVNPGLEMMFELDNGMSPSSVSSSTSSRAEVSGKTVDIPVITPTGRPGKAEFLNVEGRRLIRCSETRWPGLYKIKLDGLPDPPKRGDGQMLAELPFVVLTDPGESSLTRLGDEELLSLSDRIDVFAPANNEELMTATTGGIPGKEIWKYLMAMALVFLVLEIALERIIAINRRVHKGEAVEFRNQTNHTQESFTNFGI